MQLPVRLLLICPSGFSLTAHLQRRSILPADVKARLLGSRFAEAPQKPDRAARLAYARRGPGAQTLPTPGRQTMEADSVDDFLDSL